MNKNEDINKDVYNKDYEEKIINDNSSNRIISKNLVYIIGLSESIADKNILNKYEYLGQYGKILKIIINKKKAYNKNNKYGPTYSAYITYNDAKEASIAILSIDKIIIDNNLIRASFGTTKYCQYYLDKNKCINKNCVYLHKKANPEDIINKEDLHCNNYFYNQQIYAIKLADIYNCDVKEKLMLEKNKKIKTIFPSPYLIYDNEIVIQNTPKILKINKLSILKGEKKNENVIERNLINTIKINELETSNSTNCLTLSSRSNDNNNNFNSKFNLNREKSRFDFVNNNNNNEVEIPDFIFKINELSFKYDYLMNIYQRNNNKTINDILLYKEELDKINYNNKNEINWKNFLLDNNSN